MLSLLSKELFYFLFAITAAGVVPCGGPKMSPRTSSIVQIIFSFWSFEISDYSEKSEIYSQFIHLNNFNGLALFRFACPCTDSPDKIRKITVTVSGSMLPDL